MAHAGIAETWSLALRRGGSIADSRVSCYRTRRSLVNLAERLLVRGWGPTDWGRLGTEWEGARGGQALSGRQVRSSPYRC